MPLKYVLIVHTTDSAKVKEAGDCIGCLCNMYYKDYAKDSIKGVIKPNGNILDPDVKPIAILRSVN